MKGIATQALTKKFPGNPLRLPASQIRPSYNKRSRRHGKAQDAYPICKNETHSRKHNNKRQSFTGFHQAAWNGTRGLIDGVNGTVIIVIDNHGCSAKREASQETEQNAQPVKAAKLGASKNRAYKHGETHH